MKVILGLAALAAVTAGAASGAVWEASQDKGLQIYGLRDGTASIEMVCDPEGIWTTPEYHVVVTESGTFMTGNNIEVSDGAQLLSFPLSGGSILGSTTNAEEWNNLVDLLTTPGTLSFTAGTKSVSLTNDATLSAACALVE